MYQERKAIEAAAFFLRKAGGEMGYYRLVKLMYLADREQVSLKGRTITGDEMVSLPWGPALSNVLDAVRHDDRDEWCAHIRTDHARKRSALVQDAPPAELSRADLKALEAVWDRFGAMSAPELMCHTHGLPEYTDTEGRVRIELEDVARAVGHSEDRIDEMLDAERERRQIDRFLDHLVRTGAGA